MAAFKTDGTFTSAAATGQPRLSWPIDGDAATYIVEQDYIVLRANYAVAAFTDTHPVYTTAYFIGDSPLQDLGGGVVRFTRSFSVKPATRDEYETYAYNFIGFMGVTGINVDGVTGRYRFTQTVISRLSYTYYRIAASGGDYTTAASIPLDAIQQYYVNGFPTVLVDYLFDSPPFDEDSVPSRTTYEGWISGGTEIIVECAVRRWRGSFYERETRRVKAL